MLQIQAPPLQIDVASLLTSSALFCLAAMLKCCGALSVDVPLSPSQGNLHLVWLCTLASDTFAQFLNHSLTTQVFLVAEAKGFTWDPELKGVIQNLFSAVGQTGVDENGFKVQRAAESSSNNRSMSNQRRWSTLIDAGVASSLFRFAELPGHQDMVIPPGFCQRSMGAMFSCRVKDATPGLKEVANSARSPDWYSPAPRNEAAVDADVSLWRYMKKFGKWDTQGFQWMGSLLSGKNMLIRNIAEYGDVWFWPLADSGLSAKMGWPAQEVLLNNGVCYSLVPAPSPEQTPFLHVLALSTWEAIEVAWESPLCLKVKHPGASQHAFGPLARRLQEPQPIINYVLRGLSSI